MKQRIILDEENKIKVIQNFLIEPYFQELENVFMGGNMPWFFNKNSLNNTSDRSFMFTHMIYDYKEGWVGNDAINNIIGPMVWSIKEHLNFKSIFRIKANLTTEQGKQIIHPAHYDYSGPNKENFKIAIFHVNTCNGYTQIKEKKINNVSNQLIMFNNVSHKYATATNVSSRVIINFGFFT